VKNGVWVVKENVHVFVCGVATVESKGSLLRWVATISGPPRWVLCSRGNWHC